MLGSCSVWVPHQRRWFLFLFYSTLMPVDNCSNGGIRQKIEFSLKWEVKGWLEGFQQRVRSWFSLYYMKFYIQIHIMHQLLQIFLSNEHSRVALNFNKGLCHMGLFSWSLVAQLLKVSEKPNYSSLCKHPLPTIIFFYGKAFLYSLNSVNRFFLFFKK